MSIFIQVKVGDQVLYNGEPVTVLDYYLTPNGIANPELVAVVVARRDNGNRVSATSDKFVPLKNGVYRYPSDF